MKHDAAVADKKSSAHSEWADD